tara:strand:+ start:2570 stop:3580 length:1011 start_codon:yes stop_codon:yes gene_type:complete
MNENIIYLFIIINIPIIFFYDQINSKINIFDKADNVRKMHSQKVSLFGGILILYNFLLIVFLDLKFNFKNDIYFIYNKEYFSFFFGLIFCFIVGLYDDKFNLSAFKKLFFNFIIIFIVVTVDDNLVIRELNFSFLEHSIKLDNFAYFFTILCVLLFMNALNMFDGINLQTGFYSLIILSIFLFKNIYIFFNLVLILSIILFLFYNNLNRAFLGDSGTQILAFLISYQIIKSYNLNSSFQPEEIFIILSIPGLDMFRLFISRILKGNHPFKADSDHLHHLIGLKLGNLYPLLIIQMTILINIIIFYILEEKLISLIFTILFYIFLFLIFKNKKGKQI